MIPGAVAAGVMAMALAGCGGSGRAQGQGQMGGDAGFGKPGNPSKATRTIEVRALDSLRFEPADLRVHKGETVTIRITNTGQTMHEFDLGDQKFQRRMEKDMQEMGSGHMTDEASAISIDPGQTKVLTWTFSDKGTGLYGCHVSGHYAGGMRGTVTVS